MRRMVAGLETALVVWAIRLGLWLLPFRLMRRLTAVAARPAGGVWCGAGASPESIAHRVARVSATVPAATCLVQALAAQVLLGRRGQPAEVRLGVAKDGRGKLIAHAWVVVDGRIILGGPDVTDFAPLPSLEGRVR